MAASLAILAVAAWWLLQKPKGNNVLSVETLADTYIKGDAMPIWSTTMDNSTVTLREAQAKEAYQKNDFSKTIELFEGLPPTTKEHFFYLGIAALKQEKPDAQKAINSLLKTRALAQGWQEDATNWYLALAYLQLGKKTEARAELTNIVQIGRDNAVRAADLLKKL